MKSLTDWLWRESGQVFIWLAVLILMLLTAVGTVQLTMSAVQSTAMRIRGEEDAARELAETASVEALNIVRTLDERLDTNNDGAIDSLDPAHYAEQVETSHGAYAFTIEGTYSNEQEIYFKLQGPNDWRRFQIILTEETPDGAEIGNVLIAAVSGEEPSIQITGSIDPDLRDNYFVTSKVERVTSDIFEHDPLNLYMKVGAPFPDVGVDPADYHLGDFPSLPGVSNGEPKTTIQTMTVGQVGTSNESMIYDILKLYEPKGAKAFGTDYYHVTASGLVGTQRYNLRLEVERESLLKYAAFDTKNPGWNSNAIVKGLVYAGENLNLSATNPAEGPTRFKKFVRVVEKLVVWCGWSSSSGICDSYPSNSNLYWDESIDPPHEPGTLNSSSGPRAIFEQGFMVGSPPLILPTANDLTEQKNLARKAGIYSSSSMTFDLGLFDFGGSPSAYNGNPLPAKFNGVIYSEQNIYVEGTLQGASLTLVAKNRIYVTGDIYTGTTADGKPVNVGLVGGDQMRIALNTRRVLHINAAIASLGGGWWADRNYTLLRRYGWSYYAWYRACKEDKEQIFGTDSDDPDTVIGGYNSSGILQASGKYGSTGTLESGVYDVDGSGFIEGGTDTSGNPIYDDFGWNEHEVDGNTFFLMVRGPMISAPDPSKGSEYGYSSAGCYSALGNYSVVNGGGTRMTRRYEYDPDITRYPPPHFPVPLNGTRAISYVETDEETALVPVATPTPVDLGGV